MNSRRGQVHWVVVVLVAFVILAVLGAILFVYVSHREANETAKGSPAAQHVSSVEYGRRYGHAPAPRHRRHP